MLNELSLRWIPRVKQVYYKVFEKPLLWRSHEFEVFDNVFEVLYFELISVLPSMCSKYYCIAVGPGRWPDVRQNKIRKLGI